MAYNIGLNVIEVDGLGSPAIAGAATSVGAFNIITSRGVPNKPMPVTSFTQFVAQFGNYTPNGLGAYLVKGFFDNGGQTAYINRVVSMDATSGASAASQTLTDGGAVNTLKLNAGSRGILDPGSWGNTLYVKVAANPETLVHVKEISAAVVTGTVALAATVDMSALLPISVVVDNEPLATNLTFKISDFPGGAAAATPAQIRDAINRQTTKLSASLDNQTHLQLSSMGAAAKLNRSFTQLQIMANNAVLGFTTMAAPVFGTPVARATTGTQFDDVSPFAVGDAVRISDGTKTSLVKLQTINPSTNDVSWFPAISDIASYDPIKLRISKVTFNLNIAYGGNDDAHIVETWSGLSMEVDVANYAVAVINDAITGSKYVVATNLHSTNGVGANVPASTTAYAGFTQGRDGTPTPNDFIGDQSLHTGFFAFDPADVQLVTCERTDPAITTAALAYCAGRGDCMYVGSIPQGFVAAGQAIAYGQAFQGKKVYGALYGPWILTPNPIGVGANPVLALPPSGHVMGIYARIETNRGIWKSPAGDEANLLGVLDVEYRLSETEHTALVKQGSVNGIRAVPGAGVIVDASRTLSTDTRWLYVNSRLLFNYVKSSLKTGLRWVRQEPNRDTLWDAIKIQTVRPFLMGLWRQGAFGTGTSDQVFTIICDATNNPPDQVDQGNLKVEIYFYPSKPAETIIIIVGQQPSGASSSEA